MAVRAGHDGLSCPVRKSSKLCPRSPSLGRAMAPCESRDKRPWPQDLALDKRPPLFWGGGGCDAPRSYIHNAVGPLACTQA
jgi:hypothetical protein